MSHDDVKIPTSRQGVNQTRHKFRVVALSSVTAHIHRLLAIYCYFCWKTTDRLLTGIHMEEPLGFCLKKMSSMRFWPRKSFFLEVHSRTNESCNVIAELSITFIDLSVLLLIIFVLFFFSLFFINVHSPAQKNNVKIAPLMQVNSYIQAIIRQFSNSIIIFLFIWSMRVLASSYAIM